MPIESLKRIKEDVKEVKAGWSWTLFFFSTFLGIPLFLRKLPTWGGAMLVLCIFFWVLTYIPMPDDGEPVPTSSDLLFLAVGCVMFGFTIFFGIKGNETTAKNLLEYGWSFHDDEDPRTEAAKYRWSLA